MVSLTQALRQGEGELKILDRLVRPWAAVAPRDSHAVVAGDADLVLMGLMARRPHLNILASVSCSAFATDSAEKLSPAGVEQNQLQDAPCTGNQV